MWLKAGEGAEVVCANVEYRLGMMNFIIRQFDVDSHSLFADAP